ncbi:uncharacterized protein FOMMEDRAFT_146234 [Fomitiporia mediterranea MF3/22]|uniref:uncharacterized protein n=1 Tax=Fomitiporia mediterranea (strain MF3/22) TaxID=694068 RepID=UPI0004407348|nr:uncharacterized protein FOMMEDRAFT_146234 [Fomitiporia mediterranea MF3/22]EJD04227.1 hypothetical protein FOMMEDRAFT_146234 [Fomitiporia mediterranea MF3/22]
MRTSLTALLALSSPLVANALNVFDWLYPNSGSATVSNEVVPHRIAVIGAGAGGSSAAFWLSKAKTRAGVSVEVDVFERAAYVGGRSTTVFPYDDRTLDPVELGASIFVTANKNLWRASQEFNLTKLVLDDDGVTGFWDGEKFVFTMKESKGILGWIDTIKALWRYGYRSPARAQALVQEMIDKFVTLYTPSSPSWSNISELASDLGWVDLVTQTAAQYLDAQGVSQLFSREIIEAASRVNYGQNLDELHALEGAVSMAASGASSVKGGNFQIFEHFLGHSGAHVYLNTSVISVTEKQHQWILKTSTGESKNYNDVIIAAPYHTSGINVALSTGLLAPASAPEVPPQPYVHLHVTLLTTTALHPDPAYFGLKPGSKVPQTILTTYEGARRGGRVPEFNSLSYHGKVSSDREEYVVKIFSNETLSDEWLKTVFGGKVGWVLRKEWDAYPRLPPTDSFPPVVLAPGLYYVNAFEPFISTMETETISSRNVVDQLFRSRFGVDICGKAIPVRAEQPEPIAVLEGEVEQLVLSDVVEESAKAAPKPEKVKEDFVLGWDCA